MPGTIRQYDVPEGATVQDVLNKAGLATDGFEIRINGQTANPGDQVEADQTILLVRQIKGNLRRVLRQLGRSLHVCR
jgi:sulfur carrier protein ThiS